MNEEDLKEKIRLYLHQTNLSTYRNMRKPHVMLQTMRIKHRKLYDEVLNETTQ